MTVRNIGPTLVTGRVVDIEIDPKNPSIWYVASAFGGLWKTENRGITFEQIFPRSARSKRSTSAASSSIRRTRTSSGSAPARTPASAARTSAPASTSRPTPARPGSRRASRTPSTSARSSIDPRNSNVVYVAAQGPLFSEGGDRGVYKTTDGGATWTRVAARSTTTPASRDVVFDPKNPDIMFAGTYQRRRHVGQMIGGGPDGGIFKTTNAGKNVDEADEGPAARRSRPHRARGRSEEAGPHVRADRRASAALERRGRGGRAGRRRRRCGGAARGARRGRPRRPRATAAGARSCTPMNRADAGRRRARLLQVGRQRRDVDTHQPLSRRRPGVLLRDLRRSAHAGHDLVGQHELRVEQGRRPDLAADRHREQHRRAARCAVHVDHHEVVFDPTDPQPHPDRQRRRHLRDRTTSGKNVALLREPADHAVLPRVGRQRGAVLHASAAARRTTSRSAVRRARRTRSASRTSDWYIVSGGDGFFSASRSRAIRTSSTRRRRTAASSRFDRRTGRGRRASGRRSHAPAAQAAAARAARAGRRQRGARQAARPRGGAPERRGGGRGGGGGAAAAIARTGTRRTSSARTRTTRLYWAQPSTSTAPTIAATTWTRISPDLSRNLDWQHAADHGQGLAAGLDRAARVDDGAQQRSCRSTSRRCSKACSTSAPTTVWCRSPRTAARTGARSRISRACRSGRT